MKSLDPMNLARVMMALSDDDKLVALAWIERAAPHLNDAESLEGGMLANILDGTAAISVKDGEVMFRLTDAGMREAEHLVLTDPEAQRMLAALRESTRVDGPEKPQ